MSNPTFTIQYLSGTRYQIVDVDTFLCIYIGESIDCVNHLFKLQTLINEREDVAYRLRYAYRQMWATEKLSADLEVADKAVQDYIKNIC